MEVTKKIRRLMVEKDWNATQLANAAEISQSNLSKKMKNESYSVADLIQIAEAAGAKLKITFVLEDGTEI